MQLAGIEDARLSQACQEFEGGATATTPWICVVMQWPGPRTCKMQRYRLSIGSQVKRPEHLKDERDGRRGDDASPDTSCMKLLSRRIFFRSGAAAARCARE